MKKSIIIIAVLFVVLLSAFAGVSASEKKVSTVISTAIDQDPPNSVRINIDGVWYLVIYDSYGSPIEVVRIPVRE
ncbi:MAG: hypothetical protein LWX07_11995 [Bacteroidetes bacterium]|nr:hypothetical protein [Bacteroidota bacterium]